MKTTKHLLIQAILKILRPLVRVLMRFEVSHGEFSELAKQVYVDAAYRYFSIPSRNTTVSRVAVLTGLSRKEVARLTDIATHEDALLNLSSENRASKVVSAWLRDEDFLNEDKKPIDLSLKGDSKSFQALVEKYGGDVTVGSILEELERVKAVVRMADDKIRLTEHAYVPNHDDEEKIKILSMSATDLLETIVHNLESSKDNARFQRQVVFYKVPEHVVEEFKQYSNEKSLELLLDYNRWLGDKLKHNKETEKYKRVGVGIYYFENENKS